MQLNKVGEVKLFKVFGHFSLVFLIAVSSLSAGSFEDFKRTQSASFKKYKDERDNKFASYLKSEWNSYSVRQSPRLYEEKKPKQLPFAREKITKKVGPIVTINIKDIKKIQFQKESRDEEFSQKDINFDFYGSELGFDIPSGIEVAKFYPQNQKGIASFFDVAAKSEYQNLIDNINSVCQNMKLNDWATYLLVRKISSNIFPNMDEANLLSWFIFNKLGYFVKVGLSQKHIVPIFYSKKVIYSTPNYSFGKNKFYVFPKYEQGSYSKLYSYKQNYPDADRELDLSLDSIPNFASDMKTKMLSFKEYGKTYSVPIEYNQNLIDFMGTYPQADYETFFNAPLDARTYATIATGLKKYIDGKKASDALNFVLHFVQKSFKYERDNKQFGREKVMFAEETLYFDKSDCEDRAILFANLVKKLFKIKVIGVKYRDHMATALYIPMSGDSVKKGTRKFVIADPTYIDANIGQSMPRYRHTVPEKFITLKKTN